MFSFKKPKALKTPGFKADSKPGFKPDFKIDGYDLRIIKKPIKHIYFKVYPQTKKIVISAPLRISSDDLNRAFLSKKQWLDKQISKKIIPKPALNKTFSHNETILFMGKAYPVKVIYKSCSPKVIKHNDEFIQLFVRPGTKTIQIQSIIDTWYRYEIKKAINSIIYKWEPVLGVRINEFRVKKMRTRWGSCNIVARRIWLNFHLIKLDEKFLEYVVVHEMIHLLEKKHNARFKHLMSKFIPQWPDLKQQLNLHAL